MKAKKNLLNNRLLPSGVCLPLLLITFCCQSLHAADWAGGTVGTEQDWNTAANWSGGVVPNNEWASIWKGPSNFPVISANVTVAAPSVVNIGSWDTSRLDHTAGTLAMANGGWEGGAMLVGSGNASGTYNIADTAAGGGTFTGFGTGSGSFASGAWGGINLGAGWWWDHSTAVMNINTSGTVNSNGQMLIAGKSGDVATANLDAGTVTIHGGWQDSVRIACIAGASTNSTGSLNMSGGTLTLDHRLVIGTGSTTSTRTGTGTPEDPYVYSDFLYADGSASGTVTMTGGTITCNTVYDAGNGDAQNWHAGVNMASAYDGSTGGTATFNLDGGTLSTVYVFSEAGIGNDGNGDPFISTAGTSTFNFNGGTLKAQAAPQGWLPLMYGLTRANVRNAGAVIDTNGNNRSISQMLAHSDIETDAPVDGGLTKKGAGQLTVSSAFTYTGDTKVDAGTLTVQTTSFADASAIRIASGAILNLNTVGATDIVGTLYFGTTQQAAGTWGSTASGATHQDDTRFTGTGVLSVTIGPAAGYTSWTSANGATGQTMDQDHDGDGVKNGIEYFMGQTGSTFTANPAAVSGTVTWPMGATYTGVYGTDYEVQYSTDLVNWTKANVGTGDNTVAVTAGTSVVYDMPAGGKSFVRLVVKN